MQPNNNDNDDHAQKLQTTASYAALSHSEKRLHYALHSVRPSVRLTRPGLQLNLKTKVKAGVHVTHGK